jgi:C4-dicarboxylate-specific signal transduction histidine kinase/CheY-like chemotaxis protein
MKPRLGLRGYLFVGFAVLAVAPIVVLGVYEMGRWRRVQVENADQQHVLAARAVVGQLGLVLSANSSALEEVADQVRQLDAIEPPVVQQILAAVRTRHPTLTIYLTNLQLISIAADPPLAGGAPTAGKYYGDRAYMKEALARDALATSTLEVGRITHVPNIHMAMPVRRADGRLVGAVGTALDLVMIKDVGVHAAAAVPGLRLVVTDSVGHALVHPDPAKERAMYDLSRVPLFAPVPGDEPTIRTLDDDAGTPVRAVVATLQAFGQRWTVAVLRPEAEVAREADATAHAVIGAGVLLLLVVVVGSAALASWLASPIVRLAAVAAQPARHLPVPAPRRGEPREFARLLVATDAMLRRLDAHTDELEAEVARRTAELTEVQRRLAMADRMSSLGTLAAGMAHEINNPLTYVISNLDYARAALAAPAPAALTDTTSALDDALDGAHRVRRLVHDLRTYSYSSEHAIDAVDVNAVVDSAIKLAANQIKHLAQLSVTCGAVPRVSANEPRLVQIVLNLLINAAQAIPEGDAEHNRLEVRTFAGADGRVAIAIRDTGCGIPPEVLQRIFDPFYTTKPIGVGTGLGLFICHGLVTSFGGEITVDSEVGHGSTFTVWLPAAALATDAPAAAPAAQGETPALRLLVVDDDARVGRSIERLARGVHAVTVVTSGAEALARLARGEAFDLILCDIMMPEMDGPDFHAALGALDPTRLGSVVFMTGGTFTARTRDFVAGLTGKTLEKPFSRQALLAVIREAAAAPASSPAT